MQSLTRLYKQFIKEHNIDTILTIDGGTDSLMKGNEDGLGDPIEDCVSVTTAALLTEEDGIRNKLLLTVGFGMDRFNTVSDADSLRAVAELTALGGYLGSVSIEPSSECFTFYKDCVDHIYEGKNKFSFIPITFRTRISIRHVFWDDSRGGRNFWIRST